MRSAALELIVGVEDTNLFFDVLLLIKKKLR